jgi:RND family efflux transporter MFP subunit
MNRVRERTLALLLVLAGGVASCRGKDAAPAAAPGGAGSRRPLKFPVAVQTVDRRPVEYAVTAVGSVEAFETVQVTARVQGAVERVRFAEGERVKAGAPLVEIEPQRFRLAVEAARAALEKAKAARADAQAGLDRRQKAVAATPGLIPGEEIATWRTRLATADAEVAAAEAAHAQAALNLRDAFVRAPVAGTIESRQVQTGQYVQPGTVLATLVRREPLLVRFTVPSTEATQLRPGMTSRFRVRDVADEHEAKITHVSQAANPATRMVTVTGEVQGDGREALRPGAFVEVTIPIGAPRGAPVIPQTAVRPTERGFVAYVVDGDKARERILTLGLRTTDGRVEVKDGLVAGEQVVVAGAEALRDGAQVAVERPQAPDDEKAGQSPKQNAEDKSGAPRAAEGRAL